MRRNGKTVVAPDGSDTAFTLALVLSLFGVLSGIGPHSWAATSTLFILAAAAGIGGLVMRHTNRAKRERAEADSAAAGKAQVAELEVPLRAADSPESTPGARLNASKFYRYPMNRVAAIFDDLDNVTAALPQLQQAGFDLVGVNVLSGQEGVRLLDVQGSGRGRWARALRVLQRGGAYEGETLRIHDSALRNGAAIVYVPVRNDGEERSAVGILRGCGGRSMFRFRRWTIEPLPEMLHDSRAYHPVT